MTPLLLLSPLDGWCLPLAEVPDPVFAQGLAGQGLAIDPTSGTLVAPCAGEVVLMPNARHAVTIRTAEGHEILMHIGIDTVAMGGEGFSLLVAAGQQVAAGDALVTFDLDKIARGAKSCITPVLVTGEGSVRLLAAGRVKAGEPLMEASAAVAAAADPRGAEDRRPYRVAFDHGLHARPAAELVQVLKPFTGRAVLYRGGKSANALSAVSVMALGVRGGDEIEIAVAGPDAARAHEALRAFFGEPPTQAAPPAPAAVPGRLTAVAAAAGVVLGTATQLAEPELPVSEQGAGHDGERRALDAAIAAVRAHLEGLHGLAGGEQRTILAAHVELIQDPELADRAAEWLARGKSAGFAWRRAVRSVADAFLAGGDMRMAERAADLRDIENQVLRVLAGRPPGEARQLPERAILIAGEILPSQLITLDAARIAGLCTARGGPTSHVAIIAAAMGIPALVAAGEHVLAIADGTLLLVDADAGELHIDPDPARRAELAQADAERARVAASDAAAAAGEAVTRDGTRIHVVANLGAAAETQGAVARGAEGCGLLRTEFLFLDRRDAPGEDEQLGHYQAIADALAGRPLTIRTMDIGGDKPIPYLPLPREDNPALGLRGLRTSLWRPALLETQLRAILRVKGERRILLPMITDASDLAPVRALLDRLVKEQGVARPPLGAMIETPASALLATQLARELDFLSVGTNDLSQYTLAMDRGHPELAARLDALHPAVLRLIGMAADAAHDAGREIAVCGGLAADPDAIPLLVGLGIGELSAVPAAIPRVKRIVRGLDRARCRALAQHAITLPDAPAVRALMSRKES